ncbi:hypothetical protein [Kitasatospora sp. DSM 101779]|uniref:hypothetical protein n=1 Tax=Kitasatospora sp. DSM 101779 TaxID=2853165 RepID=UPI0021DA2551|nr:hypothetical protein [Kitasatospora sp. DSM 101779]MCU7820901.1 hypothetical protein [Kitasatospora sp. DSM 101779]
MDLRADLLPPPVPAERLAELAAVVAAIADLVLTGGPAAAQPAVDAFNRGTGHGCTVADFAACDGGRGADALTREAARPAVRGTSRAEAAELVRRVWVAGPDTDWYLRVLRTALPHPHLLDLLFHSPARHAAAAEDVVDTALAYRPIAL